MGRKVGIVGAGLAGAVAALELAERGCRVVLFDAAERPLTGASWVNEGKIHLGYVYGGDPSGHTLRRMIDGALEFGPILRRWLGAGVVARAVMQPFDYAVPGCSQLMPAAVEAHFDRVQAYLAARLAQTGGDYLGQRRPEPWRRLDEHRYGSDGCRVLAAYRTPERAVDPRILGTALCAVLRAHPGIELRLSTRVQRLRPDRARWRIVTAQGEDGPFDHVVNAAWQERRRIDAASGFADAETWLTRYKYGAILPCDRMPVPNVTLMLGCYGDVVGYGDGRCYLSWYPAMMLAQGAGNDLAAPRPDRAEAARIAAAGFEGLRRWIPALAALRPHLPGADLAGGFIVARGASGIDDPHSGLHRRDRIGVICHAPGYTSLDTGKYTTAPLVGRDCADSILGAARTRAAAAT